MTLSQMCKNTCICATAGVFFLILANGSFFAALGGALLFLGGCFLVGGVVRWLQENEPKRGS
jgi:hypothetical protein